MTRRAWLSVWDILCRRRVARHSALAWYPPVTDLRGVR